MRRRAVYKAISWETISNVVCLGIAYCMFGHLGDCILFTLACIALKLVGYYYHEGIWEKIK